jgi:hypothetical protein
MTAVAYEMTDSESGSVNAEPGQAEVRELKKRFVIGQCDSFELAFNQIKPYCPRYIVSAVTGSYYIRKKCDVVAIGNKYFDVTAQYATLVPTREGSGGGGGDVGGGGDYTPGAVAWDTTGKTEHITQAYSERTIPDDADSFEEAINVSGDSVNGIDRVCSGFRYSETWQFPIEQAMADSFIKAVYTLTGTVNDEQFRCFDPGEALFLGARGQWSEDQPFVPVTFEFEARPNIDDAYVKGMGETWEKKGWEYQWIRYEDAIGGNSLVKKPRAVYINEIYKKKSWDDLLIGSGSICEPLTGVSGNNGAGAGGGFS